MSSRIFYAAKEVDKDPRIAVIDTSKDLTRWFLFSFVVAAVCPR